jgi:uncharacterized membrane protein YgcG
MTQTAPTGNAGDVAKPSPRFVRNARIGVAAFVIAVLLLIFAVPRVPPPPPTLASPDEAFVDRAGIVKPEFARRWAGALLNDDRAQIVIYVDRKMPADDVASWAIQTASDWKIGAGRDDTGLVLFVFTEPRVARLDVGYGLEGVMTDARSRQLLEGHLAPAFAAKDYERGFDDLIRAIRKELGGEDMDSIIARYQKALKRDDVPWTTELVIAIKRIPRVTVDVARTYLEADAGERAAILVFASVVLAIAALGIGAVVNTGWRLATLRARLRAPGGPGTPVSQIATELVFGPILFFICLSMVALVMLFAQSLFTREGRFSGAGAMIVWPETTR